MFGDLAEFVGIAPCGKLGRSLCSLSHCASGAVYGHARMMISTISGGAPKVAPRANFASAIVRCSGRTATSEVGTDSSDLSGGCSPALALCLLIRAAGSGLAN
jgi:hypothetical protein